MKQNTYDLATDILKLRIGSAFGELKKQYGKSNPYRQEPIDSRQEYYNLSQMMTPDQIQFAKQNFDPIQVDALISRYEHLKARYENA